MTPQRAARYFALSAMIKVAEDHAATFIQVGATNSPIFLRSPVNSTSGTMAKESCTLSTTWLASRSFPTAPSP